ncbi:MAG: gluconate 2-dehydrogenase subunit 3 family protein [Gemmatimonadaceae bacterium]
MDRRDLLQWLVATGGLAALRRLSPRDLGPLGEATHQRLRTTAPVATLLSPDERRIVAAAAEQIIPRTDTPGATDAHVAEFVDVMLAEWYPAADAQRFRDGVAALDATSRSRFGVPFDTAAEAQQVQLVQALDEEVTAIRQQDRSRAAAHWFGMLKFLTVWGFCTSEAGMREVLGTYPRATHYDGAAPLRRG